MLSCRMFALRRPNSLSKLFDDLGGFTPYSFAKPSFTGGKCLKKQREWYHLCTCFTSSSWNMTVHLSRSFGLRVECLPILLGGS